MWAKMAQKGQFMSINGKNQGITINDLLTIARYNNINRPERLIEQAIDVISKVEDYLREDGVNDAAIKIILSELNEKYTELRA